MNFGDKWIPTIACSTKTPARSYTTIISSSRSITTFPRSKSERYPLRLSLRLIVPIRHTWSNVLSRSTVIIPLPSSNVRRNTISSPMSWARNEIQLWLSIHQRWTLPAIPMACPDRRRLITWWRITMQRPDLRPTTDSTTILVCRMCSMLWIVDHLIKNRSFDRRPTSPGWITEWIDTFSLCCFCWPVDSLSSVWCFDFISCLELLPEEQRLDEYIDECASCLAGSLSAPEVFSFVWRESRIHDAFPPLWSELFLLQRSRASDRTRSKQHFDSLERRIDRRTFLDLTHFCAYVIEIK